MSANVKVNGSYKEIAGCKVKANGVWQTAQQILTKKDGVWKSVWRNKYIIEQLDGDIQLVPPVVGTNVWRGLTLSNVVLHSDYLDEHHTSEEASISVDDMDSGVQINIVYSGRLIAIATFTIDRETGYLQVDFTASGFVYGENTYLEIGSITPTIS